MRKIAYSTLLILAVTFVSCNSGSEKTQNGGGLEGEISISGAFALYPLAVKWAEEFEKINPNVRIDVQAGGAGKGMADALANQVSLGMVSRDINEEELKKGAWFIPVTKDAVIPTFNASNPYANEILQRGLTKKDFTELWVEGKIITWGQLLGKGKADEIKVYKRSDAAGAAESWAKYLGKKQDDLKGTGVFGDPGLANAVKKDVFGIGFNNVIYVYELTTKKPYEGVRVIPIDINENGKVDADENFYGTMDEINNAIATGKYPSPPARELFFVSKGKPQDKLVTEFLKWVLADGQKYVKEAGFINLDPEKIKEAQEKLK